MQAQVGNVKRKGRVGESVGDPEVVVDSYTNLGLVFGGLTRSGRQLITCVPTSNSTTFHLLLLKKRK